MTRPNPLRTAWVLCTITAALACGAYLLFGCSSCSSAMPKAAEVQAFVMCHINASADLPKTREAVEALPVGEAKALLLTQVDRLRACAKPDGGV